jgi:hypothetical protein
MRLIWVSIARVACMVAVLPEQATAEQLARALMMSTTRAEPPPMAAADVDPAPALVPTR